MIMFKTRTAARSFARRNVRYSVVDLKNNSVVNGRRWAVRVL